MQLLSLASCFGVLMLFFFFLLAFFPFSSIKMQYGFLFFLIIIIKSLLFLKHKEKDILDFIVSQMKSKLELLARQWVYFSRIRFVLKCLQEKCCLVKESTYLNICQLIKTPSLHGFSLEFY